MDLVVSATGEALWAGHRVRCALGKEGIIKAKREGDAATPAGVFPLRQVLYRADRLKEPPTEISTVMLSASDGWCDDPADVNYNGAVRLPYPGHSETLWRDDGLYDVIAVLGHNDDPVEPGLGSAIFLHVARPDFGPTEGCVAMALHDLLRFLAECGPLACVHVEAP